MLEIDLNLLLVTVVVFLGMIYLLNAILYKPILKFVDERNQSIADEEKELARYGKDTKKYEEESARILANARAEVSAIKASAIEQANAEAKERIEARKKELETEYKAFEDDLKKEHEELKAELLRSLPNIRGDVKSVLSKL